MAQRGGAMYLAWTAPARVKNHQRSAGRTEIWRTASARNPALNGIGAGQRRLARAGGRRPVKTAGYAFGVLAEPMITGGTETSYPARDWMAVSARA